MNSLLVSDAYKQSHIRQYPKGTTMVYSNWTPRSSNHAKTHDGVIVFGIQAFLMKITRMFDRNFFGLPEEAVVEQFEQGYFEFFGEKTDSKHVRALHRFGSLPVLIKALPEGLI